MLSESTAADRPFLCSYCDSVMVARRGDCCSPLCADLMRIENDLIAWGDALDDENDDRRLNLQRESEV